MRTKIFFTGLLLCLFSSAMAQKAKSYKGSLTYTLGPDTTAMGNFELKGNNFVLNIVGMSPNVNVNKLKGTFATDGQLLHLEGINYAPTKDKDPAFYAYKLNYAGDTTYIETKIGGKTVKRKYPVKIMEANAFGGDVLVFMHALLANYAPKRVGDSVLSNHIAFNSARKFMIKKTSSQKLMMGSAVMGMFTIYLDKKGIIESVDGLGTSFNIKGKVGAYLNIDSVIAQSIKHQASHPKLTVINKPDSIKVTVNGVDIKIAYSRPLVRRRVIFGEVVPFNRVWRTGADAATKITLSKPIYFNGQQLAAGAYSVFSLPTQTGCTLIFNKQANIWGTEHNADNDVLKVPMTTQTLDEPVELLTFAIDATGANGAVISFSWDRFKASVSFATQP